MIKCKDCEHWRHIRDEAYQDDEDTVFPGPHGECRVIDNDSSENGSAWIWGAYKNHEEMNLITVPDFSCSLSEPKGKTC